MDLELFVTAGLGDTSYLLASEGEALLVDPQRDAWRFLEVAEARRWRVRHVLETHVHNDYLSGALETRAATGAGIVAPGRGGYEFEHRGVDEGDVVELGALRLTAMATPGHTPEHLAWLVHEAAGLRGPADATPLAVFTGGSLLVGSAGRTDLLGASRTDELTTDLQASLRRLAALPDTVQVLPTHGAGSFCSAGPPSRSRVSTIGAERFGNPTFRAASENGDAFRSMALGALGRYPAYYAHMAAINRRGPGILGGVALPPRLDPAGLERAHAAGATIVDARDRKAFAAGHLRGALNIELDSQLGGYVGWLLPFDAPLVLVLPEPVGEALREVTTQLLRIGYERIAGFLDGGIEAWVASGRPTARYETLSIGDLAGEEPAERRGVVLDVRQPIEWRTDGVIPGSRQIFVADIASRLGELPAGEPVTVVCKSGQRASMAASLLDAAGIDVRLVADGGTPRWPEPLVAPAEA